MAHRNRSADLYLQIKTQFNGLKLWKMGLPFFLCLLNTSGFTDEVCNGVATKSFTAPIATSTTCTVTSNITVGPNVTVGDDVSLYAPGVGFTGPVNVEGTLRVAASNPYQDKVWQTNLVLVEVSAIDKDSVQVSWLPVDDGVTPGDQVNYEIHLSQTEDFLPSSITLKHQQAGIQSAQIDGLTPGATYYARMLVSTSAGLTSQSRQHRILLPAKDAVRTAQVVVELSAGTVHSVAVDSVVLVSGTTAPQVGDLITSNDPALLRRITAVTTNGDGSITLQTAAASLGEVYQNIEISSSIALAGVPPTSSPASLAYLQKNGPTRSVSSIGGSIIEWPQSGLTLSVDTSSHLVSAAPASLISNMRIQAVSRQSSELYSESDTKFESGSTLTVSGPKAVAIVPGASGAPTISLVLDDATEQELCSVGDLEIDEPSGKSGTSLVSIGALTNKGNGIYTLSLPINASVAQIADSAYKVRFTAKVDDIDDNCSGGDWSELWKEQLTFDFDLFVVSSPNFPVSEEKTLTYSGDFSVTNSVNFSFAPALEAEVKMDGASLEYARLEASTDAMFDQELVIVATAAGSIDQTKTLLEREFVKVFMAGYVPVVMKGTLSTSVRVQGNVTGTISAVEHLHMGFDELAFGFEYRNGDYYPIKSIEPAYSLSIHGDADAEANLTISLLPALEVTFYEAATGKLIAEPYLTVEAGIHGQIHKDMSWNSSTVDMDYWLTKGSVAGGVNLWLYGVLEVFDYTLVPWPNTADIEQYETFHKIELIKETSILGLPSLTANDPGGQGFGHPENSRAIRFTSNYQNVANPFKSTFGVGPSAFITFTQWVPPKVIATLDFGYQALSSLAHDTFWIDFDQPGTYIVRMGGHSSMGGWARQVANDITISLTDNDSDGMIDQWEMYYGITDANANGDSDELTNLQEFQHGRNPNISDDSFPSASRYQWVTSSWGTCQGDCGGNYGAQPRDVWCETNSSGIVVDNINCDVPSKPATSRSCTTNQCQWIGEMATYREFVVFDKVNQLLLSITEGLVYKYSDSAENWVQMPPPMDEMMRSMKSTSWGVLGLSGMGNLYITQNGGSSWTRLGAGVVSSISSYSANDSGVIIAADYAGLNISFNAGGSWMKVNSSVYDNDVVEGVYIDSSGRFYVSVYSFKTYRSIDGGKNWEVSSDYFPSSPTKFSSTSDGVVYVGSYWNGVYKSEDYGLNWTNISDGLPSQRGVDQIFINSQDEIFALLKDQIGSMGLYLFDDVGEKWKNASQGWTVNQFRSTNSIAWNGSRIWASQGLFGIGWSDNNGQTWNGFESAVPQNVIGMASNSTGELYVACNNAPLSVGPNATAMGILSSSDNGETWRDLNEGLEDYDMAAQGVAISKDDRVVLLPYSPGKILSKNASDSEWIGQYIAGISTTFSSIIKDIDDLLLVGNYFSGVHISTDGENWSLIDNGWPNGAGSRVVASGGNGDFYATAADQIGYYGLYRYSSSGVWNMTSYPDNNVQAMSISDSSVLVASYNQIYKSNNYGATWSVFSSGLPQGSGAYALEEGCDGSVYAAVRGSISGVFKNLKGTSQWTNLNFPSNDENNTAYSLAFSQGYLFAGGRNGVYRYSDTNCVVD